MLLFLRPLPQRMPLPRQLTDSRVLPHDMPMPSRRLNTAIADQLQQVQVATPSVAYANKKPAQWRAFK